MAETDGYREITVRLTRDRSFLSYLIYFVGFGGLTHASIGLDKEDEFFYSFNTKGFRKEYLHPRRKRLLNTATYRIRVTEESYQNLKTKVLDMYENRESYGYSGMGVALCFTRLPLPISFKNRYFCSQFVAKSLSESGCIQIRRKPEQCFPKRIGKELSKSSQLIDVSYTKELVPVPMLLVSKIVSGKNYVVKGVIRGASPFLNLKTYNVILRQLRLRLNPLRYLRFRFYLMRGLRQIKKTCVYIMYEQYKEIFSKGEDKNG